MQINFFAAARAAAGVAETQCQISQLPEPTLAALLDHLRQTLTGATPSGQSLADILPQCSFLLDGRASPADASLEGVQRLDVLPPFAGG
ncbi:MoaD/ThiS family protein [Rothia sp. (in: high G+C Gram-positive bacteria)]|uniref:MoaD/ThiS family protein n=1 Tax=Rothia sp. (in: high G+C Gram-positive bacteria) TaxID=1885016 RepID=UPI000EB8AAEE|nr:molybdopterin synthase sulfur carrier subunit [Rothia sp. (in: high G+C Gram-positive bacteria)]